MPAPVPDRLSSSAMGGSYHRLTLVFVDGIGLGPDESGNPFASAEMPALRRLLGGPLVRGCEPSRDDVVLRSLDACLGVPGLPQSATGQTALFTGVNAPAVIGRHVPALPGPGLRSLVDEHGILGTLRRSGRRVTFANAFTSGYLAALRAGERRPSVTTWSMLSAGIRPRTEDDLASGAAVTWDVVGDRFGARAGARVAPVSPREAGRRLARLSAEHDLVLYETFLTDLAGHRRWGITAVEALGRLDGLVGGLLESGEATMVLTSDHGNLEEREHRRHTRNPVPLLAVGPLASVFRSAHSLIDVTPAIRRALGAGEASI